MSYLRKLWNEISEDWKNIFIQQFSIPVLKFSNWNTLFISQKFLENIYFSESIDIQNFKVNELSGLKLTPYLKKLRISNTILDNLDGIEKLYFLTELIVTKNVIKNIYPVYFLKNLNLLDISYNQISYLFPLFCSNLEVLYCNHNKIKSLDGLENVQNLKIIDASYNKLTELDFTYWKNSPYEIWVAHNKIEKLMGFDGHFTQTLEILDLSHNPIYLEDLPLNFQNELIHEGIKERQSQN